MSRDYMFRTGQRVEKPTGYPYPGTVVAVFQTLAGETRLVVESQVSPGMLHIFNAGQLALQVDELPCRRCGHPRHQHMYADPRDRIDGRDVLTCRAYAGMGDTCGCEEQFELEN